MYGEQLFQKDYQVFDLSGGKEITHFILYEGIYDEDDEDVEYKFHNHFGLIFDDGTTILDWQYNTAKTWILTTRILGFKATFALANKFSNWINPDYNRNVLMLQELTIKLDGDCDEAAFSFDVNNLALDYYGTSTFGYDWRFDYIYWETPDYLESCLEMWPIVVNADDYTDTSVMDTFL